MRFYFSFEILLIAEWFVIEFFFNYVADIIPDFTIFFNDSSSLIEKDIFIFIKMCYISTHFWKHYTQWLNFIIIIFVISKVFITLFKNRNFIRYQYFFKIYIIYQNWVFMLVKFTFIPLPTILKVLYSCFTIKKIKNSIFIVLFFLS